MKYFNIAADFKKETIDQYVKLNEIYSDSKIVETFGQITVDNMFGSGRPSDMIPLIDLHDLESYVSYSNKRGIAFNYSLNATCLGNLEFTYEGTDKIIKFLDKIYEIGVRSLTVAIPFLIDFIKQSKYKFDVKASTLCDIINSNKAISYKNLGADRIVVHESINRNFKKLKEIRECFGPQVEVIVNVICHKDCIFRPFHQNQGSHDLNHDQKSTLYYSHKCMLKRMEGINNFFMLNWVRPEDLKYYLLIGINHFKIQGRHNVLRGDPVKAAEAYMKESYDGNLLDLLDLFNNTTSFKVNIDNKKLNNYIAPFVEKENFCSNNCSQCEYCVRYAKNVVDSDEANLILEQGKEFYHKFDLVNEMIRKQEQNKTSEIINKAN